MVTSVVQCNRVAGSCQNSIWPATTRCVCKETTVLMLPSGVHAATDAIKSCVMLLMALCYVWTHTAAAGIQ